MQPGGSYEETGHDVRSSAVVSLSPRAAAAASHSLTVVMGVPQEPLPRR